MRRVYVVCLPDMAAVSERKDVNRARLVTGVYLCSRSCKSNCWTTGRREPRSSYQDAWFGAQADLGDQVQAKDEICTRDDA
jgi:hypothetical protein